MQAIHHAGIVLSEQFIAMMDEMIESKNSIESWTVPKIEAKDLPDVMLELKNLLIKVKSPLKTSLIALRMYCTITLLCPEVVRCRNR